MKTHWRSLAISMALNVLWGLKPAALAQDNTTPAPPTAQPQLRQEEPALPGWICRWDVKIDGVKTPYLIQIIGQAETVFLTNDPKTNEVAMDWTAYRAGWFKFPDDKSKVERMALRDFELDKKGNYEIYTQRGEGITVRIDSENEHKRKVTRRVNVISPELENLKPGSEEWKRAQVGREITLRKMPEYYYEGRITEPHSGAKNAKMECTAFWSKSCKDIKATWAFLGRDTSTLSCKE